MQPLLKISFAAALIAAALATFAGIAAAGGNAENILLNTPKTVSLNHTSCTNASGCLTIEFEVSNNTTQTAACDIYVPEINFDIPIGSIGAGSSAAGQVATPYLGQRALTFDLNCDGTPLPGHHRRVRVVTP